MTWLLRSIDQSLVASEASKACGAGIFGTWQLCVVGKRIEPESNQGWNEQKQSATAGRKGAIHKVEATDIGHGIHAWTDACRSFRG